MSQQEPAPEPLSPSKHSFQKLVIIVGLVVGLVGLVMTILGIGGVSPTHIAFSNTISIQTTSGGVIVLLVGFGMATFLYNSMIRVDLEYAKAFGILQINGTGKGPLGGTGKRYASRAPSTYAPRTHQDPNPGEL